MENLWSQGSAEGATATGNAAMNGWKPAHHIARTGQPQSWRGCAAISAIPTLKVAVSMWNRCSVSLPSETVPG